MIRLLKDCFDKKGNRYKVISFNGEKYQCQSYSSGKCSYFSVNEISSTPMKTGHTGFKDFIRKEEEIIRETDRETKQPKQVFAASMVKSIGADVVEPVYEEPVYEMPQYDYGLDDAEKFAVSQDNDKETVENDFYADF